MKTYDDFLRSKIVVANRSGFDVDDAQLHPQNLPHQNAAIKWAASMGRALIAASFGLGKTRMQCELARLIHERTGKPFLVVCPLGVKHQFVEEDGPALGMAWRYVRNDMEALTAGTPYLITNYERVRDGNITPHFIHGIGGVSLDEGSVLRSLGSKTSDAFKRIFSSTLYRYVFTATPAPNEYKELIYYAEWIGVMDHGQALTRWFKRTTSGAGSAGHLVLMDSQAENFWMWVSTWALFISRPSDLGYSDDGYIMPDIDIHWHRLSIDYSRAWDQVGNYGQRRLIPDASASIRDASKEKHATLKDRVDKMLEIALQYLCKQTFSIEETDDHSEGAQPSVLPGTSSGVRDNPGRIQCSAEEAGRGVRDLRKENGNRGGEGETATLDVCGSRSQDREDTRDPLQSMQLRPGSVSGRSDITSESSGVSKQLIIWCNLNEEQAAIEKTLKQNGISVSSIYGSLSIEETERRLYAWKCKETTVLLSKPIMLGSGVNLQQCGMAIYAGIDCKFQDFIQSVHRIYRYLQKEQVHIHIIFAESEDGVVSILKRKWKQHDELISRMQSIIKQYGLSVAAIQSGLTRSLGVKRVENKQQLYTAVNNDCVEEMKNISNNSIDAVITSIPFSNHYEYVASYNDFGHNQNDEKFFEQMDFLIPQLYRVLIPGRFAAIHVKDLIHYGHLNQSGFMEVDMFSYKTWAAFKKHGFLMAGEITITTDVVRENNSTYRLGWTEMTKDGSKMGTGLPEKVLLFRKPPSSNTTAYADKPIVHKKESYSRARWQVDAHGYWRSNGNALVYTKPYDYEDHIKRLEALDEKNNLPSSFFVEPPKSNNDWVWDDINPMLCLNSEQARRKLEAHVCPLPLDIVRRLIERTTSDPEVSGEAELILDPFAGLFTVPYLAIQMGRRGYGIELSDESFSAGVKYCQMAEQNKLAPTLFDIMNMGAAVPAD